MQFENYTDRARGLIQAAQTIALRDGHQQFTPEHVLKALLDDQEGLASNLIRAAGGQPDKALQLTDEALGKLPKVEGGNGQIYMAAPTAKVFAAAPPTRVLGRDVPPPRSRANASGVSEVGAARPR